jgi:hypothetical protein
LPESLLGAGESFCLFGVFKLLFEITVVITVLSKVLPVRLDISPAPRRLSKQWLFIILERLRSLSIA